MSFQPDILMWEILLSVFCLTQLQTQSLDTSPLITPGKELVLLAAIQSELVSLSCHKASAKMHSVVS